MQLFRNPVLTLKDKQSLHLIALHHSSWKDASKSRPFTLSTRMSTVCFVKLQDSQWIVFSNWWNYCVLKSLLFLILLRDEVDQDQLHREGGMGQVAGHQVLSLAYSRALGISRFFPVSHFLQLLCPHSMHACHLSPELYNAPTEGTKD